MTPSPQEIADWCERQIIQKQTWLADHGPRAKRLRPDGEIETKRRDITMLESIRADYAGRLRGAA